MDEGKKRSIRNRRPPNYLFAEVVDLIGRVKTLSCTDMGEPIIPKSSFLYFFDKMTSSFISAQNT